MNTFVADVDVDPRRRVSLGKAGHRDHTRYRIEEDERGVLTLTPLVSVPITAISERLMASLADLARGDVHPRPERTQSSKPEDQSSEHGD